MHRVSRDVSCSAALEVRGKERCRLSSHVECNMQIRMRPIGLAMAMLVLASGAGKSG